MNFLSVFLVFMLFQSVIIRIMSPSFVRMIETVQKEPITKSPTFFEKSIGLGIIGYIGFAFILYYFILLKKESIFVAFLLGATGCIISDFTLYCFFEQSQAYLNLYLLDIGLVGGSFALTTYLFQNYDKWIQKYIWVMIIPYAYFVYAISKMVIHTEIQK